MRIDSGKGQVVEELSFTARGDASASPEPIVLSCGGIYIPHRKLPMNFRNWQRVVNLPVQGSKLSATIFGISPELQSELQNPLNNFLKKESLN